MKKQNAFTLIEVSIVLVVIGLIVGGILVGGEMVHQSKLRATATQAMKFQTAVTTFYTKYQCHPGDCLTATMTDFGLSAGGDGNGFTTGSWEGLRGWVHLAETGMIEGSYDGAWDGDVKPNESYPALKLNDSMGWRFQDFSATSGYYSHFPLNTQWFRTGNYVGGYYVSYEVLTPEDAQVFDNKIDDGLPLTGRVMMWSHPTCGNATAYNISSTALICNPHYRLNW